jgi:hypothetical protein
MDLVENQAIPDPLVAQIHCQVYMEANYSLDFQKE